MTPRRFAMVPVLSASLLVFLGLVGRGEAHNGAVVVATPVSGLRVDGDLSDWPPGIPEAPVAQVEYGDALTGQGDLSGWLRVGYDAAAGRLYVGVRVLDQSVVVDDQAPGSWQTQDGCELYLDVGHGRERSAAVQYAIYGGHVSGDAGTTVTRAWQRGSGGYQYEWSVDLARLSPGQTLPTMPRTIGFDLALGDRDDDGSFSWVAWGRGTGKMESVNRRGDVLLGIGPAGTGQVRGRVAWAQGPGLAGVTVELQSVQAEALWTLARTDAHGAYQIELPAGRYRVRVQRRETEIDLAAGKTVDYSVELPPPRGREVRLGPGRVASAGVGLWRQDWQTLAMQDGLPDDGIASLCQGADGTLWIGSMGGHLTAFDGETFTTYSAQDGLPEGVVRALAVDAAGAVWLGTDAGELARLRDGTLTVFTGQDGLGDASIRTLLVDAAGALWLGTDQGLVRFDGRSLVTLTVADGLSGNAISCLAAGAQGGLWVGTPVGLTFYDGQSMRRYSMADGLSSGDVCALLVDDRQEVWAATAGGGLDRLAGERFVPVARIGSQTELRVSGLVEDQHGRFWIGTSLGGMFLLEGAALRRFGAGTGPLGLTVNSLLVDREGTVWAGTHDGGLSRYEAGRMRSWLAGVDLPEARVTRILEDRSGACWMATAGGGLVRWRGSERRVFTTADGLGHDVVWALLEDDSGVLWAGTQEGVSRLSGDRFVPLVTPKAMAVNTWDLLQDRSGAVWIAAQGGLARYRDGRFELFGVEDGLIYSDVRCLLEDREGGVWMGTIYGLSRYRDDRFTSFTTAEGLSHNDVRYLLETTDGRIWVATQAGISQYDGRSFTHLTTREGLANNNVWTLAQDREGTVWVGSYGGVSRVAGDVVQSLLPRDGLAVRSVHALREDHEGRMWIGGRGGVTLYEAAHVPPTVLLTEVMTDGPLGPQTEIRMPSTQRFLAFEYRGVSLKTRPGGMLYRYRFGGPEAPWQTTSQRRLEFADLGVGRYALEIEAVNRDLDRSATPVRAAVVVHPPYGQMTLWSLLVVALIGLGGVGAKLVSRNRQVRRSQARFRNLLELAPDAVIVVDRDGRMILVNVQAERMFGYRRDELLGQPVELLVPARYRRDHAGRRSSFLRQAQTRQMGGPLVLTACRKEGDEFPVEIGLSSLTTHGEMLAFANVHDITERQRIQRELERARAAADEANQAKSAFLANMSHEIRTPMNGIVGMVDLLKRTRLEKHQRNYLSIVDSSADALLELINDILDLSKIEAGSMRLEETDFVLWEVLEGVMKLMAMRAHGKGLELSCHVAADVPEGLRGDPTRLRQIVVNLIGNAIKFTATGEIAVSVACVERTATKAELHLAVRDTGIGIPADKQQLIFEAFSQADSSTTRQFGGTGLGLSISRQLVDLMQGRIWVESEPGQGSTFQFTARFGVSAARAARVAAAPWKGLGEVRVLAVDDHATSRLILAEMLGSWGLQVELAESGAEALAAVTRAGAAGEGIDLVLLDGAMPGMDGLELARRLQAEPGWSGQVLMMLSSLDDQELVDRLAAVGVRHHLRKPITQSDLLDGIVTALGHEVALAGQEPGSADGEAHPSLRVLLADDNPTNQYVATSMLEEAGHRVVTAGNGLEVLAHWQGESFDLVLMDVQMPEMDGYQATAAIRQQEQGTGRHLPIIGLTANAMKGDREACLAAGMDDYVPKPVRWAMLHAVIERLQIRPAATGPGALGAAARAEVDEVAAALGELGLVPLSDDATEAAVELAPELLARLDEEFGEGPQDVVLDESALVDLKAMEDRGSISVAKMVDLFGQGLDRMLPLLRQLLDEGKMVDLRREAHTLKGSARDLGARRLALLCQQLEDHSRNEELAEAESLIAPIATAAAEARAAIAAYLGG